MGRKNSYYLIGRDTKNSQFEVISLGEKRYSSLEEIDIYTANFPNSILLSKDLIEKGLISQPYIDYYIVHQRKYQGKTYLKTDEVLFANSSQTTRLAKASLEGTLKEEEKAIDHIMNQFCFQMKCHPKFYQMVLSGETNIYQKFIKYFMEEKGINFASLKYRDGGWIKESYPLLRNIIEGMIRYYDMNEQRRLGREEIENKLLEVTNDTYDPLQYSLFEGEENGRQYQKEKS